MFAATPVIATRIAGAPEVIRDGDDGFLVEPGDPKELADRVGDVLDLAPEARATLGARGLARAQHLFDEDAVLDDLFRAYDRLL